MAPTQYYEVEMEEYQASIAEKADAPLDSSEHQKSSRQSQSRRDINRQKKQRKNRLYSYEEHWN